MGIDAFRHPAIHVARTGLEQGINLFAGGNGSIDFQPGQSDAGNVGGPSLGSINFPPTNNLNPQNSNPFGVVGSLNKPSLEPVAGNYAQASIGGGQFSQIRQDWVG